MPIRGAAGRYPQLVDAALAVALAGLCAPLMTAFGDASGLDWWWYAALHVPLVWRRRAPVVAFWTVIGISLASMGSGADGPSLIIVPMVAGYALARYRPRRHVWPTAVPLAIFVAAWVSAGGQWWDALALSAMFAASVLLGTNVRTRRAYLAELEDRALRLERERDQQAQLAVAAERARIAREMHDIVAHNLAVMVALADGAVATTPVAPQRAVDLMGKVSMTGREALREVRRLVGLLHDGPNGGHLVDTGATPAPQPGFHDLDSLIDQVRAAGVQVVLTRDGVPGRWGPGAGLAVYRVVQEALTNTMKHAGLQSRAEVRLRYREDGATLTVIDDGGGNRRAAPLASGHPAGGHGLAGMSERVAPYGGVVEAGPRPRAGWRVHARLTFDHGEDA